MRRAFLLLSLFLLFFGKTIAHSPNAVFVSSREGDPESLVKNVSTIHGDYSELEIDLCITGPDLLTLSRFYTSKDTLDIATFGGWRFQPQTFFLIRPNPERSDFQTHQGTLECLDIFIGTPEGSLLKFSGFQNWENSEVQSKFLIDFEEDEVGLCNIAKGHPSSWTNIKNHVLYYYPQSKSFELHLNSGGKRIYVQDTKSCQFLLSSEILPSGNQILYAYDEENRITQIKMTTASGNKTISWITLEYNSSIIATASDGTSIEYSLEKDISGTVLLTEVKNSSFAKQYYYYQIEKGKALLTRKKLPNERYTEIHYEREAPYRVINLSEPIQKGVESSISFAYAKGITEVHGPMDQKTRYYYDEEKHLTAIEEILDNTPYRIRKKQWGERKNQGNIIALSVEDRSENIFYYKTFSYDFEGNIIEENEYGNLTGQNPDPIAFDKKGIPEKNQECHSKKYFHEKTPDEDIVSQTNEQGNGILFAYIPKTSILKRKEILENKKSKRRTFYDYNEDGVLIRITIDNGNIREINEEHQKFIIVFTPKQDLPNLGAPEIIEEKAYDSNTKSEILLKKYINHFNSRGFTIKQDIYDRNDTYVYSLEKSYDNAGRLTSQKDPIGNQTIYTYDTNGNLIQEETLDLTIHYDYDMQNKLTAITHNGKNNLLQKIMFAYDVSGNKILEVDTLGNKTEYRFDHLGRTIEKTIIKSKQDSENTTWTYTYNLFDRPITITDPLKNTTTVAYNIKGKPTHITGSDGREEVFIYSLEGNLYRHTTPQGITKAFIYDCLGRTTKIKYYKRRSMKDPFKWDSYYYDAFHLLSESTSNGDIKYTYNSQGDLIQSILAQNDSGVSRSTTGGISKIENGEVTDFAYDSLGRLIETKKWKDDTHYSLYLQNYDLLGHVVEERIKNEQGKTLHKKQFTYTPSGKLFEEIGFPNNQKTILAEYSYDPLRRLSQVKKGNSIWDITYEENNGIFTKTIKDPLGSVTEESYNHAGLLQSHIKKDPNYKAIFEEVFTYDPLNNLTQEKNSNFELSYTYTPDALCKSIAFAYTEPSSFWNFLSSSSNKQETLQHTFTYNTYGDLIHKTVPSFEKGIRYTYNSKGNLSHAIYQEEPKGKIKDYAFRSDKKGNIIEIFQRKPFFSLQKIYNTNDQILKEEINDEWGFYIISFKYDAEGCLTEIILPDHSSIHYIYEGPFVSKIRRLSKDKKELYTYEIIDRDLMGNVHQEFLPKNLGIRRNTYDTQGRKVETLSDFFSDKVIFDPLGNPIEKLTKQGKEERKTLFTYDYLSQLIAGGEHSYQYDSLQNLILKDKVSYIINPHNQTTKSNDFTCEYDACGNLQSLSDALGTLELQFDPFGRLILTQTPEGEKIHYIYDFDFRRFSKKKDNDTVERYFYLGGYELGVLDEEDNIKALRIPINPNSLDNTSILSIELDDEVFVPFTDLQKNVRCLVNPERRTIVESYNFSAFGEEQIFTSRKQVAESPLKNPWRFQGKRHDSETGFVYYGARYYSPKLQKWISPDPIGSHDSLNLYLFCHNNPLKYYDPWGLAVAIDEDCGCVNHNHPGYYNRPEGCICICGQKGIGAKMSGVIISVADFAADTWNHPCLQGSLQAIGGLAETMIGGGMALSSAGIGAPVGGLVMVHGLDHFLTGLQTAFTGEPRNSVTNQLLQMTGISSQTASMFDSVLSIAGGMGGIAAIRASRTGTIFSHGLSSNLATKPTKIISEPKEKIFQYHPRIRIRALQDPVAHNFPYSFDKVILKTKPIKQIDGTLLYRQTGTLNGKQGIYEIGLNPNTEIIFHRTFKGGN